jgi:hypothetical protein
VSALTAEISVLRSEHAHAVAEGVRVGGELEGLEKILKKAQREARARAEEAEGRATGLTEAAEEDRILQRNQVNNRTQ